MRIVLWWSFFTAATGWAWSVVSLIATRALFGAGEAGCFPEHDAHRSPPGCRAASASARRRSCGWRARWGGAFTPLLVAFVLDYMTLAARVRDLRRARRDLGGGVLPLVSRRSAASTRRSTPAELALLPPRTRRPSRHGAFPGSISLAAVGVAPVAQYICLCYGWYFYITWLPTYLRDGAWHHADDGRAAGGAAAACLAGSAVWFQRWLIPRLATRIGSVVAAPGGSSRSPASSARSIVHPLLHRVSQDPRSAMIVLGFAGFFNDFVMPAGLGRPAWTSAAAIRERVSGA